MTSQTDCIVGVACICEEMEKSGFGLNVPLSIDRGREECGESMTVEFDALVVGEELWDMWMQQEWRRM